MWLVSLIFLLAVGYERPQFEHKPEKTFWKETPSTKFYNAEGQGIGDEYGEKRQPFFVTDTVSVINGEGYIQLRDYDAGDEIKTMPTDTSDMRIILDWQGSGLRGTLTYDLDSIQAGKIHVKSVDTTGKPKPIASTGTKP